MSRKDTAEEEVYDIKGLLRYEDRNGKDYYLVEWRGYPIEEATWEPRENFINPVPEIIERMEKLKKGGESPTAADKDPADVGGGAGGDSSKDDAAVTALPPPAKSSRRKSTSVKAGGMDGAGGGSDEEDAAVVTASTRPSKRSRVSVGSQRRSKASASKQGGGTGAPPSGPTDGGPSSKRSRDGGDSATGVHNDADAASSLAGLVGLSGSHSAAARSSSGVAVAAASPARQDSTMRSMPEIRESAPLEYTYVRSIRQDSARGICAIFLKDSGDPGPGVKVPIASARLTHPQAVIDFLLDRIQFVPRP